MVIDFDQFVDRQLFCQENGKVIYRSVASNGQVMFDIDQKAFVVGECSDRFTGKIKNNLFVTRRGWCDPQCRGSGLITTIMIGLFRQKDFAIMSDSIFSPDGRATWLKLCNVLQITNYYVYDGKTLQLIDKQQMLTGLTTEDPDVQFIIEHTWPEDVILTEDWTTEDWQVMVFRGGTAVMRFDFSGLM